MKIKNLILAFIILAIGILAVSCADNGIVIDKRTDAEISKFETSQELKKFNSAEEIREYLKKSGESGQFYSGPGILRAVASMDAAESSKGFAPAAAGSAGDFSATNIQVEGVDEADFVKNDGKYIYLLSQEKLVITEAFPAENAKIVSETEIKGNPRNLFLNKGRIVVFADASEDVPVISEYDFVPRPQYKQKTHVYIYDISDKSKPKLVKDYNLNGNYFQSRMIGDYVYFVAAEYAYYGGPIIMPVIKESSTVIARPDVYYFDNPENNFNFNTIASFNIFDDEKGIDAKTFMMGYTNTLYVSQNNIYIAYQKNLPYTYYREHNEDRFYEVVVPLLSSDVQAKISSIKNDAGLNSNERWSRISGELENMYNTMDESQKKALIEKIENAVNEYEAKLEAERRKTIIHKIKINNGNIEYGAKAEVPGYLLNQFSMDEHEDNLRVATTTEIWTQRENVMYNNVFVLGSGMNIIGKLEAIAPDERIYSTRFIGDRLYMVTFKRIDPLFVIGLSDPSKPEILGELKIPGYSDYLHPYDEEHLIGIGKDTEANEWGGVSTKGVKLALFDVSDVKNPKPIDTYVIGEAGTDSEVLRDHKAFLFDKKKNLLVIPVMETKGKMEYDEKRGYYRQRFWQGAYVFGFDAEKKFEVKGKISHSESDESTEYYYYGSQNAVRRSLYMDDALYTISMKKIKANGLDDMKDISEVKLPYEGEKNYPYPVVID